MCLKCRYLCFELKASRLLELFRLVSMQNGVYSVESKSSCFMEAPIREKKINKINLFLNIWLMVKGLKQGKSMRKYGICMNGSSAFPLKRPISFLIEASPVCLLLIWRNSMILKINLGQQFWRFHSFLKQKPISA